MTNPPNNPPAFPMHDSMGLVEEGMSLRDWFAGQAMEGMCSTGQFWPPAHDIVALAGKSYQIADAMLKAREEEGKV